MTDHIDTNKAQLQALGQHQPLCLAAENEALKSKIAVMTELLRAAHKYIGNAVPDSITAHYAGCDLIDSIDEALAGKLPDPAPVVQDGWVAIQASKAHAALEAVQDALEDAYGNAMPVCCGRGNGIECCGNPAPDWSPEDQRIMDVLSPIQRELSAMLSGAPQPQGGAPCDTGLPLSKSD